MRWARFTIFLLAATIINSGNILDFAAVGNLNIKPDLLLIIWLFFCVNCDLGEAIITSFAIGFAADISGATMGPYMLVYGLIGTAISQLRKVVIMRHMLHQGLAVLVIGTIAITLTWLLTLVKTHEVPAYLPVIIPATTLYSAVAAPFLWSALWASAGWFGIRRRKYGRPAGR